MENLFSIIQDINESFKGQKLSTLTIHDEHMLLRTIASTFNDALKSGKIKEVPAFALDADKNGSMIVRLLTPEEVQSEADYRRFSNY